MKNQKGVSMITLIITIIVIIILAAIAFVGMDDATGSAQFSGFASEFGDYATNFQNGPYSNVTEAFGLAGKAANKTQKYYAAARKVSLSEFDGILNGVTTPAGYTFVADKMSDKIDEVETKFVIKDATGAAYTDEDFTVFYQIANNVMSEYTNKDFYGDANGEETHWVTDTGLVFTLPGFPREVDGEERMYITASLYYNPLKDGGMLTATDDCLEVNFGSRNESVLATTTTGEGASATTTIATTVQKAADATDVTALKDAEGASAQTKTAYDTATGTGS